MLVELTALAESRLREAPARIQVAFATWKFLVELRGIEVARSIDLYDDHHLTRDLEGFYGVTLDNDHWRVTYRPADPDDPDAGIVVEDVHPHDYGYLLRSKRA